MVKPSQRREIARSAVAGGRTNIRHACQTFEVRQTVYRYHAKASEENARIADWLVRLTTTYRDWGFGWNHKLIYSIYRELGSWIWLCGSNARRDWYVRSPNR